MTLITRACLGYPLNCLITRPSVTGQVIAAGPKPQRADRVHVLDIFPLRAFWPSPAHHSLGRFLNFNELALGGCVRQPCPCG